ncbi:zf-TFIIB domain-containing protein [Lentisphaerota bacterium WC36G]|nr:zf-TFIIB domain-containing protein [Lentisphaerae bacterium WC36]
MNCVKCDGVLVEKNIDNVKVDICKKCSGIWFDFDELEQIMQKDYTPILKNQQQNNTIDDQKRAVCPRCGGKGKMINIKHDKYDIHIDSCSVCYGLWLDGGEYDLLKEPNGFFAKLKAIFSSND